MKIQKKFHFIGKRIFWAAFQFAIEDTTQTFPKLR